ncbi:MAG: retroviral-like aspartic protease family protein [Melioribacteraceae bacterium]|nr:retroviral-like aspartic protease family protein [Melioribacteraceae bacterium]MCF8355358.1 retroviral-like aspartic protease family protein [Melioribacteraceae bacterium]MCF8395170.1 retroviral-like aspartic protease family protein [Melioribacteraceae bacterium]MCF8420261.1 retroviral-like aspartic protease family protein [Melioribacteraceae bacterium]
MIIPYRRFPAPNNTYIYRPIIEVKLKLKTKSFSTWAIIDSGADRTMINKQIGKQLGYDFKICNPASTTHGVYGEPQPIWDSKVELEVDGFNDRKFLADISYLKSNNFGVLLGHKGFFEFFDIKFQTAQNQFEIELAAHSTKQS